MSNAAGKAWGTAIASLGNSVQQHAMYEAKKEEETLRSFRANQQNNAANTVKLQSFMQSKNEGIDADTLKIDAIGKEEASVRNAEDSARRKQQEDEKVNEFTREFASELNVDDRLRSFDKMQSSNEQTEFSPDKLSLEDKVGYEADLNAINQTYNRLEYADPEKAKALELEAESFGIDVDYGEALTEEQAQRKSSDLQALNEKYKQNFNASKAGVNLNIESEKAKYVKAKRFFQSKLHAQQTAGGTHKEAILNDRDMISYAQHMGISYERAQGIVKNMKDSNLETMKVLNTTQANKNTDVASQRTLQGNALKAEAEVVTGILSMEQAFGTRDDSSARKAAGVAEKDKLQDMRNAYKAVDNLMNGLEYNQNQFNALSNDAKDFSNEPEFINLVKEKLRVDETNAQERTEEFIRFTESTSGLDKKTFDEMTPAEQNAAKRNKEFGAILLDYQRKRLKDSGSSGGSGNFTSGNPDVDGSLYTANQFLKTTSKHTGSNYNLDTSRKNKSPKDRKPIERKY